MPDAMKRNYSGLTLGLAIVIALTSTITYSVFSSRFAKTTIDAWSFGAALFLIMEAAHRIYTTNERFWPRQFIRVMRIIIGVCVFTIHMCQVIYGI